MPTPIFEHPLTGHIGMFARSERDGKGCEIRFLPFILRLILVVAASSFFHSHPPVSFFNFSLSKNKHTKKKLTGSERLSNVQEDCAESLLVFVLGQQFAAIVNQLLSLFP